MNICQIQGRSWLPPFLPLLAMRKAAATAKAKKKDTLLLPTCRDSPHMHCSFHRLPLISLAAAVHVCVVVREAGGLRGTPCHQLFLQCQRGVGGLFDGPPFAYLPLFSLSLQTEYKRGSERRGGIMYIRCNAVFLRREIARNKSDY